MKWSESSIAAFGVIETVLKIIKENKTKSTFAECIEVIECQLEIIKHLEGIKIE